MKPDDQGDTSIGPAGAPLDEGRSAEMQRVLTSFDAWSAAQVKNGQIFLPIRTDRSLADLPVTPISGRVDQAFTIAFLLDLDDVLYLVDQMALSMGDTAEIRRYSLAWVVGKAAWIMLLSLGRDVPVSMVTLSLCRDLGTIKASRIGVSLATHANVPGGRQFVVLPAGPGLGGTLAPADMDRLVRDVAPHSGGRF